MTADVSLRPRPRWWLAPAGFAIGFLGSLCGIGGGLFAVPLLHYLVKVPLPRAVASGLVLVVATTAAATGAEALQGESQLHGYAILALAAGVLVGAQLGYRVSQRVHVRVLRWIFVVFLSVAGVRIVSAGGGAGDAAAIGTGLIHGSAYVLAGLVGIGGGFVAPILGVGGGLLMVPGLFLVLPSLGFPGARASALAAGVVASSRALFLHARAGRVHWGVGGTLALGALLGAASGVVFVHRPGLAEVGRPLLAVVLWFVAARFVVDLRRGA